MSEKNYIDSALQAGRDSAKVQEFTAAGIPHIAAPKDLTIKSMEELLPAPTKKKSLAELHTPADFINYVNRFNTENTAVYIDGPHNKITAILDYHSPENNAWGHHRAIYNCPPDKSWGEMMAANNKKMDQEDMAYFIESIAENIIQPDSATMLEIVSTLKTNTQLEFNSATNLNNGQVQLKYHQNIDGRAGANGQLEIPTEITLAMKPLKGEAAYTRTAKFRYRITNGHLSMWYSIVNPEAAQDSAIKDLQEKLQKELKTQNLYLGAAPTMH